MRRCDRCDQSERVKVRRAKLAECEGRVAVVLDVPMQVCPDCGERWLEWDVARRLDEMFVTMLASEAEVSTRHFDELTPAA